MNWGKLRKIVKELGKTGLIYGTVLVVVFNIPSWATMSIAGTVWALIIAMWLRKRAKQKNYAVLSQGGYIMAQGIYDHWIHVRMHSPAANDPRMVMNYFDHYLRLISAEPLDSESAERIKGDWDDMLKDMANGQ